MDPEGTSLKCNLWLKAFSPAYKQSRLEHEKKEKRGWRSFIDHQSSSACCSSCHRTLSLEVLLWTGNRRLQNCNRECFSWTFHWTHMFYLSVTCASEHIQLSLQSSGWVWQWRQHEAIAWRSYNHCVSQWSWNPLKLWNKLNVWDEKRFITYKRNLQLHLHHPIPWVSCSAPPPTPSCYCLAVRYRASVVTYATTIRKCNDLKTEIWICR